ncbi:cytochrome c oxidase subunit 3 [Rhodopila sp.]|uniref:cytochrome c oxidase subunit 3 n=1 Tax=Rhodopila sp. TaxID=2480087 RepID=UPI003D108E09
MSQAVNPVGIEVAEHFATADQQRNASMLGMWAWLLTELLLFAGLFLVALVLRVMHPTSVTATALHLKFWIGAGNTAILILSSLTMSAAIQASRLGWQKLMVQAMLATAALGTLFLLLKGYEWYQDYVEHMTPFLDRPYALGGDQASKLFMNVYYLTTALHGLHLTTGVSILLVLAWQASRPGFLSRHQNRIEVYGLYWHFIDLIWIIVFPVLYVLNR